jgi:cell division protein FtsI (penicillin-binding protein 3)
MQNFYSKIILYALCFCINSAELFAAELGETIRGQRADIVDRHGNILATNVETAALYALPQKLTDPKRAAEQLVEIFPDLDAERLRQDFTSPRSFVWIKKKISSEQKQAVIDIGNSGLLFGPRETRFHPNGHLAAHVLGGARFGQESSNAAEVLGVAGVEHSFDEYLRDVDNKDAPLQLSLDLGVQTEVERILAGGMQIMNAKGAAAILMDAHSGEVIALTSLPDFDPNNRPMASGSDPYNPLFNRAVQGVYELGSTFKIFAAAQAMELEAVSSETMVDIQGPIRFGRFRIRDSFYLGEELSVSDIIVKSSHIGTARIAQMIGVDLQQKFFRDIGMLEETSLELAEASDGKPILPKKWTELTSMTISYGHGLAVSPVHLAAGYATLANGGYKVNPTLLRKEQPNLGPRLLSKGIANASVAMLRQVVTEGTAKRYGDVPGYAVAGKTGASEKLKKDGDGYDRDRVLASFASVFPANDPKYVLVVIMDEAVNQFGKKPRRTSSFTTVPVAAAIISQVAPLLGLQPNEKFNEKKWDCPQTTSINWSECFKVNSDNK